MAVWHNNYSHLDFVWHGADLPVTGEGELSV